MHLFRVAPRSALAVAAALSISACAGTPSRQAEPRYQDRPPIPARVADAPADGSGQRLTLQSGEGEKLNVPWFIRDTQDWINTY